MAGVSTVRQLTVQAHCGCSKAASQRYIWCCVVVTGAVLRNDVVGRIMMKCLLSDMPELRLGLNEKIEDITFHQVNRQTY
jgi:hypothetical protein